MCRSRLRRQNAKWKVAIRRPPISPLPRPPPTTPNSSRATLYFSLAAPETNRIVAVAVSPPAIAVNVKDSVKLSVANASVAARSNDTSSRRYSLANLHPSPDRTTTRPQPSPRSKTPYKRPNFEPRPPPPSPADRSARLSPTALRHHQTPTRAGLFPRHWRRQDSKQKSKRPATNLPRRF